MRFPGQGRHHQILDPRRVTRPAQARHIAIGARLKQCPGIMTLGFRPNFSDYSPDEQARLMAAPKILYPTAFYADLFNTMGKATFPSYHTYKFAMDKIRQTALFRMLNIPHPRTRVFYGRRQKKTILHHFQFPFIAKIPRGSARGTGVFLIRNRADLKTYLAGKGPAYIQEYLPFDRDMRIVVIGREIALPYWRIAPGPGEKTNVSQGGDICFDPLPRAALDLALFTAGKCGWDDVGLDIVRSGDQYLVLEGNMKYGTKGFQKAGIDYKKMLAERVLQGRV